MEKGKRRKEGEEKRKGGKERKRKERSRAKAGSGSPMVEDGRYMSWRRSSRSVANEEKP